MYKYRDGTYVLYRNFNRKYQLGKNSIGKSFSFFISNLHLILDNLGDLGKKFQTLEPVPQGTSAKYKILFGPAFESR